MAVLKNINLLLNADVPQVVIATNERRFYGCFIFTKGVIPPEI